MPDVDVAAALPLPDHEVRALPASGAAAGRVNPSYSDRKSVRRRPSSSAARMLSIRRAQLSRWSRSAWAARAVSVTLPCVQLSASAAHDVP
ncbi:MULTISPECIES: hypothetical protein [Streptomyces]|uniref:hypothetical protein n=1 Tax=Streptomyces sp. NRRL S-813 TaxID=1463919 RepID=UPI00131E093F|nr:hypothetical protein [Streptomyces sp. NRRL S-813]